MLPRSYDAENRSRYAEVDDIGPLLRVLKGRIDRGKAQFVPHRGGHPRAFQRLQTFDDFSDTDPIDCMLWQQNPTPQLPRVYKRSKIDGGGAVAVRAKQAAQLKRPVLLLVGSMPIRRSCVWCTCIVSHVVGV
jgi:hypothetical protein